MKLNHIVVSRSNLLGPDKNGKCHEPFCYLSNGNVENNTDLIEEQVVEVR